MTAEYFKNSAETSDRILVKEQLSLLFNKYKSNQKRVKLLANIEKKIRGGYL